jgi:hypothetical protein
MMDLRAIALAACGVLDEIDSVPSPECRWGHQGACEPCCHRNVSSPSATRRNSSVHPLLLCNGSESVALAPPLGNAGPQGPFCVLESGLSGSSKRPIRGRGLTGDTSSNRFISM